MNIQPSRAINEEGIQGARIFCPHCGTGTVYILIPAAASDTIEETPRPAADDQPCWCGAPPPTPKVATWKYSQRHRKGYKDHPRSMPLCDNAKAAERNAHEEYKAAPP